MGKKILDSKILYVFLSVLIAVFLWFYVTSLDGNEEKKVIRNIPITFVGEDILAERGLMIVGNVPAATVEIRAAPSALFKITDKSLRLTVNVSQITEAAEYTLAYTANLPSGISQSEAEFVAGQTGNVTFNVVRFTSREVEVRGEFTGTVADGYLPGGDDEFIFASKTITISGQSNLVNQVDHVLVSVGGEGLKAPVNGYYPYQLIGVSGEPLVGLDVNCSEDMIYVTYPVWATARLDLEVKFIAGGGVDVQDIKYTMSADHIMVYGPRDAVASLVDKSITLATINLSDVLTDSELVFGIPLADELTNYSGITSVTVKLDIPDDLDTTTIDVSRIDCINVPDGWIPEVMTQILSVKIRGNKDLIPEITEENLRVVADLSNINQAEGQYNVPVKIYLDSVASSGDLGVLGTEYKVVIQIREDPTRAAQNNEQE